MPNGNPTEVVRLSPALYAELEKQLPITMVQANTTDLLAGQMIGIEMVLRKLRNGFVIGS